MSDLFDKFDRKPEKTDKGPEATQKPTKEVSPESPVVFESEENLDQDIDYAEKDDKIVFDTSIPIQTETVATSPNQSSQYVDKEDDEDEEEDVEKENPRSLKVFILMLAGCFAFIFLSLTPILCDDSSDEAPKKSVASGAPKPITPKKRTRDTLYTKQDLEKQIAMEERRQRIRNSKKQLKKMSKEELRAEVLRLESQVSELEIKNQFCEQQSAKIATNTGSTQTTGVSNQPNRIPPRKKSSNRKRRKQNGSQAKKSVSVSSDPEESVLLDPSFYGQGQVVVTEDSADRQSNNKNLIPAGHKIPAKLSIGVSSAAASAKIVAKVTKTLKVGGIRITRNSVLTGRISSARGGKIYLEFSSIRIRGKKYRLSGYAISDDMPGLVAKVVGGNRKKSSASRIAENTAGSAASDVISRVVPGGGVIGNTAKRLAQESLNEANRINSSGTGSTRAVLELKAGTKFLVLTTGG